jgi:hypothetical protein
VGYDAVYIGEQLPRFEELAATIFRVVSEMNQFNNDHQWIGEHSYHGNTADVIKIINFHLLPLNVIKKLLCAPYTMH